uniref:Uncharacterized protein n=1 Tax=Anopheles atroparvus TaxID=41427 RepID=A0AAG5DSC2_ANOAO
MSQQTNADTIPKPLTPPPQPEASFEDREIIEIIDTPQPSTSRSVKNKPLKRPAAEDCLMEEALKTMIQMCDTVTEATKRKV